MLKKNEEFVIVGAVTRQSDGRFRGLIDGFESVSLEHNGMRIGDQIEFDDAHILRYSCP